MERTCSIDDTYRVEASDATGVSGRNIADAVSVDRRSAPERKIALFRSLFRGREDVYPRRFESLRSGRSGYAPACSNEWLPGVCEKPRIKCADCPNRRFLPVTDDVVRWHLSGVDHQGKPFTMGVYPMLLDESCCFLAVDLDGASWHDDAAAFLATCTKLGVPAALERSRSGNGGHVWIFFDEALPAGLARRLGSLILTEAMEQRPDLGFHSYDRFFPNQDTLPRGGFGSLIALPLQKGPRRNGNSVFVDSDLKPFADQWAFLSKLRRVPSARVEAIVALAEKSERVMGVRVVAADEDPFADTPWTASPSRRLPHRPIGGPVPDTVEVVLGDRVYIANDTLPPGIVAALMRLAAFQNPEFYRAQAMRLPTYGKPRIIDCVERGPKFTGFPRGCLETIESLLVDYKIRPSIREERNSGVPVSLHFHGTLRADQEVAARAMLAHDTGVLAAGAAFGKTVVAAWLIAERGVNALVIVHRKQLQEQWVVRLSEFLGISEGEIGRLGGGRRKLTGRIDVALMQSLVRRGEVDDCVADYGFVIVDECHHVPARSFELAVGRAKAKYVAGLSATVTRKDGHHPIVFMQCGPVRHRVDARRQAAALPFTRDVLVRSTGFRVQGVPDTDQRFEYQRILRQLADDEGRNSLICKDVVEIVRAERAPLVLTERVGHLEILAGKLRSGGLDVVSLQGGMGRRELVSALESAAEDVPGRVLLATGRFIGEGFDEPRLDTLFLTMPISWRGAIAQYVGRLHRRHRSKRQVRVYDYADLDVPMLSRMFDKRCRGYEAVGYSISSPASAVSGWPQSVPLPTDGNWKQRYAASLRRLLRDGVDEPLAGLFRLLTTEEAAGQHDAERARSSSEAFLLSRLQSLPDTRDHFRLNARLPIPFCNQGHMEVDFLDSSARLVVELDGPHHLANRKAYRRDRRKDALLQEHGYLVLRFLAEDLGTRLDEVLDEILRALARRRAVPAPQAPARSSHRGAR